jgi:hypothetical protein
MRRSARDETPFLLTMQLRAITLVWLRYDGNVIPLDIERRDRSSCDETSYPSTNLFKHYLSYRGSSLLKNKFFTAFLGDPWAKHMEISYKDFIFYPTSIPLGLHPLVPI